MCPDLFPSLKPTQSFKGSIPKLAVHSVGARVIESVFLNFPAKSTMSLKQELYGPHFSLFVQDLKTTPTLKSNLESAKTETQKEAAIKFVKEIISKGMTKSFYGYTFFQELFAEYMEVAEPNEIRTMASSVVDHSIHMLSTRAGARVVAVCASYGTPKDRKRICKSLKGYTCSSLLHRDAYLALLRLIQVTDDTVSISKSVLNEILTAPTDGGDEAAPLPILPLVLSESASKLFLMLLVEDDASRSKYFDPYERSILEVEATVKENGKAVPTSKKEPALRRQELMKYLEPSLDEVCSSNTIELLKSLPGSRVIKEFYNRTGSETLAKAVVAACEAEQNDDTNIFEDPVGHRTIKNLLLCDVERDEPVVSAALFEAFADRLGDIVKSNRGAFVVSALLQVPSLKEKVAKKLIPTKKQLKDLSKAKGPTAGYAALMKALTP
jgi:pumilio family protein 6